MSSEGIRLEIYLLYPIVGRYNRAPMQVDLIFHDPCGKSQRPQRRSPQMVVVEMESHQNAHFGARPQFAPSGRADLLNARCETPVLERNLWDNPFFPFLFLVNYRQLVCMMDDIQCERRTWCVVDVLVASRQPLWKIVCFGFILPWVGKGACRALWQQLLLENVSRAGLLKKDKSRCLGSRYCHQCSISQKVSKQSNKATGVE